MSKGKRRGKPGQRKGDTHYTPPKPLVVAPPNDPPKPPHVQAGGADEPENDTQELTEAVDRHVRMNTWFAGAIMVATVVQAVIGFYQWRSMQNALEASNISAQRQLRAYLGMHVYIDEIAELDKDTGTRRVTFRVAVTNYGQTPAIGFNILSDKIGLAEFPLKAPFPPVPVQDELVPEGDLINPQETMSFREFGDYTSDEIRRLQAGELILILEGRIVFEDIFGQTWPFHFYYHAGGNNPFEVGEMQGANPSNYEGFEPPLNRFGPNGDLAPVPLPESEQR